MGILLCPIKYILDVAVVAGFVALLVAWDYRHELFRLHIPGAFLRMSARRTAIIIGALLLSVVTVPGQYRWLISRFQDVTKGSFGWPLKIVDPVLLTGVLDFDWSVDKSWTVWTAIIYLAIVCSGPLMLFIAHRRTREIATPLAVFAIMWTGLLVIHLGIYYKFGGTYVGWKFTSYYPLIFSLALPALVILLLQSDALARLGIRKILPVFLVAMVAIGMLSLLHSRLKTFSAGYRSLAVIDELPMVQALNLEADPWGETMLAAEFIQHKIIHPISDSYYGAGQEMDVIAGEKAAFLTNEAAGNGLNAPDIPLGADFNLYFMKPGYVLDKPIHFNANLQMNLTGISVVEPWGRWTDGKKARIEASLLEVPHADVDLTLYFRAFVPPSMSQHVTLYVNGVSYGTRSFADGNDTEWTVRIACNRLAEKKLVIELDLPDAVSPASVSSSTDTRLRGIGLTKMLLKSGSKDLQSMRLIPRSNG
jgi:hypothetical protein